MTKIVARIGKLSLPSGDKLGAPASQVYAFGGNSC